MHNPVARLWRPNCKSLVELIATAQCLIIRWLIGSSLHYDLWIHLIANPVSDWAQHARLFIELPMSIPRYFIFGNAVAIYRISSWHWMTLNFWCCLIASASWTGLIHKLNTIERCQTSDGTNWAHEYFDGLFLFNTSKSRWRQNKCGCEFMQRRGTELNSFVELGKRDVEKGGGGGGEARKKKTRKVYDRRVQTQGFQHAYVTKWINVQEIRVEVPEYLSPDQVAAAEPASNRRTGSQAVRGSRRARKKIADQRESGKSSSRAPKSDRERWWRVACRTIHWYCFKCVWNNV